VALQNLQQYGCQTGNKLKEKSRDQNRNSSRFFSNKNETMCRKKNQVAYALALNLVRSGTRSKYREIEREVVLDNHKQRWPTIFIITVDIDNV
jgi:hypothetical protein